MKLPLAAPIALFTLALLCTFTALAQGRLPDGITHVTTVEGISEYRLDNGLRVLLFRDPSKATITVNMTYFVGSLHESYGETGMAHLLEHMLLRSSMKFPDMPGALRSRGARYNGTTGPDRTNYYETLDATEENLEWALDLESDRMVNALLSQADLDTEMTVVRNEFELNENNSIRVLYERLLATAYLWHGYGKSVVGTRSDIENVPIERLRAFYRRYYQPDNAMLVVAGRFEEQRALELIARYFGPIPRPERELTEHYTVEPTQDGEREVIVRRVGDVQIVMAGFHAPAGAHEDFVPLQLAAAVLGSEPSGRLYKALVQTGLASQIGIQSAQQRDPGAVVFFAMVPQDRSLDAAHAAMIATIDGLADNPISAEEVERIRSQTLSGFEQMLNDSQNVALLLSNSAASGDWRLLFLDRDRLRSATVDDLQRVALKYFKPSNRTVGLFIPGEPDRTEIEHVSASRVAAMLEGYRGDEARAEGEAFDPTPANIDARTTRVDLPGGVKLVMLPKDTRGDTVNAIIGLHYGDEESLKGRSRLGALTTQMLMRGTPAKSRQAIQDELARLQSQLDIGGGTGLAAVSIQSTRANLVEAISLAIELLREPAFPDAELATLKELMITRLETSRSDPTAIVARAYARHWARNYAQDDPRYVPTVDEEIAFVRGVTADALRSFHEDFFGASHAEVIVVGDFDPNEVRRLIAEQLDGWRSPKPFDDVLNLYTSLATDPSSETFNTPDKENAFFLAGMPIEMPDTHPDYPALVLGNYILGSGPASRLYTRIRSREGLSYSVGSSFSASPRSTAAQFTANAIAAPQNVGRVEASFRDELAAVLRDGYTDEEVETAKRSWAQARRVNRTQDAALANQLGQLTHVGRTMAWDTELESRVQALTPAEILDAMRRHLDLNKMTFIKGGDFGDLPTASGQ